MVKSKVWIINERPEGEVKESDFVCIEEELPECQDGDIITEAECFSVDPYIRYRIRQMALGGPVDGSQVARVIESRNPKWPVGSVLVCYPGWRTHTYFTNEALSKAPDAGFTPYLLPDIGENPASAALGILGMPGNTAYFGVCEVLSPKSGKTFLVNGAAGAVGSAVVQIAKIKGCKVVAFAGSDAKVDYVKSLGADHVYNYKEVNVAAALKEAAPEGVHYYFDNVGGKFTSEVLPHMAEYGHVALCGCISTYNDERTDVGIVSMNSPYAESTLLWKQLKVEGFIVIRWSASWFEGIAAMKKWIEEGKVKYRETKLNGFEKLPEAFIGLFHGANIGKAIVEA